MMANTSDNAVDETKNKEVALSKNILMPKANVGMITRSKSNLSEKQDNNCEDDDLCSVCLEEMIHPVKLPCSHIFCFLCIKGVALTNGHICPLCRGVISSDFFIEPVLATPPPAKSKKRYESKKSSLRQSRSNSTDVSDERGENAGGGAASLPNSESYQWFYEGKNGWWRYDARTNAALEAAHTAGQAAVTLMLAGHNFTIDLSAMCQCRADGGGMIRRIKRDSAHCRAKGTAGLHSRVLAQATKGKRKRNN